MLRRSALKLEGTSFDRTFTDCCGIRCTEVDFSESTSNQAIFTVELCSSVQALGLCPARG